MQNASVPKCPIPQELKGRGLKMSLIFKCKSRPSKWLGDTGQEFQSSPEEKTDASFKCHKSNIKICYIKVTKAHVMISRVLD